MNIPLDKSSNLLIVIGLRRWKIFNLKPILNNRYTVKFISTISSLYQINPKKNDTLAVWSSPVPKEIFQFAVSRDVKIFHMEDGFIRSVGLGSDLIPPLSIVLDKRGIYFDATSPSDLEHLLNNHIFSDDDIHRAKTVREFIVKHQITKYNIEPRKSICWPSKNKNVILIPGQVEDDASIKLGCTNIRTNLDLLNYVRDSHPEAFIVYKPHPDVLSKNRKGYIHAKKIFEYADHIEHSTSIISCIEACNEVHTMTSLSGFDALLRRKKVVTYGQPFYAGWGLTIDLALNATAFERRKRNLSLEELIAGTLLHYPIYWDPILKGYTTCERTLNGILEKRKRLEATGELEKLHIGYTRRQLRKLKIIFQSYFFGCQEKLIALIH